MKLLFIFLGDIACDPYSIETCQNVGSLLNLKFSSACRFFERRRCKFDKKLNYTDQRKNDQILVRLCDDVLLGMLGFNHVSFFVFLELLLREIDVRPRHCLTDAELPSREH